VGARAIGLCRSDLKAFGSSSSPEPQSCRALVMGLGAAVVLFVKEFDLCPGLRPRALCALASTPFYARRLRRGCRFSASSFLMSSCPLEVSVSATSSRTAAIVWWLAIIWRRSDRCACLAFMENDRLQLAVLFDVLDQSREKSSMVSRNLATKPGGGGLDPFAAVVGYGLSH
jgi:hypothetical protein